VADVTLLRKIAGARGRWLDLEHAVVALADPLAIEHATIAALAMRHLHERVREIEESRLDVQLELADALERERHGTVAEYERELYGQITIDEAITDVDEAVA
jgi:cell division FtsZ-interacting protein ZapD